jgi:ubiquinone biosynthesis protein
MELKTAVRDVERLSQITQVLMRHGFGEVARRMGLPAKDKSGDKVDRPPLSVRLRLVAEDLGPTFVKLGQMASSRTDVLPADICHELKKLQDDVPPCSAEDAHKQIEESLGATVEELFESFDAEPIASASIGQVYRAKLKLEDGEVVDVAVKVRRRGIHDTVERDLDLMHILARLVEKAIPEARIYRPTGLAREFDVAIRAELDFTSEAANTKRFAANFADEPSVRFPMVYPQASSRRVLTLEFFDGIKVTDAVEAGANGKAIAEDCVRLLLKMVFEDGFFHADPHPGNIFILPAPPEGGYPADAVGELTIGLIDLGLVGRLSPELRDKMIDLMLAAGRKDTDAMATAMLSIGRTRKKVDHEAFRAEIRRLAERHLRKSLKDMEAAAMVQDIVRGAMTFNIEVPTELTMLGRAIMTIEGVGKQIYPELDFIQVATPHLTRIVMQRYHPSRLGKELLLRAGTLNALARDLPLKLEEIMDDVRHGRLLVTDRANFRASDRLGRRIRATVVCATLFGSAMALLIAGKQPIVAWILLALSVTMMMGHVTLDWFTLWRERRQDDAL